MDSTRTEIEAIRRAVSFADSQSALAALLGVQAAQVSQWVSGTRPVPPQHCVAIERATAGHVTRADLRPDDYWLIWPDLSAPKPEDAPKVKLAKAVA